uniref:Uncharacterized protein n=1 Tax=Anopheles culicifacies TaxID=139723 RepID=A0A182MID3_9DIPT
MESGCELLVCGALRDQLIQYVIVPLARTLEGDARLFEQVVLLRDLLVPRRWIVWRGSVAEEIAVTGFEQAGAGFESHSKSRIPYAGLIILLRVYIQVTEVRNGRLFTAKVRYPTVCTVMECSQSSLTGK